MYGAELSEIVSEITGIAEGCLKDSSSILSLSTAQKMSWASKRTTSRKEDEAYCLLGIFQVNMTLLYGEGHAAFFRLQREIIKDSADQSIFAWMSDSERTDSLLLRRARPLPFQPAPLFAESPRDFAHSAKTLRITGQLKTAVRAVPFTLTNLGLEMRAKLLPISVSNMQSFDTYFVKLQVDPGVRSSDYFSYYYKLALVRLAEPYGENRFARLYVGDMESVVEDEAQSIERVIYVDTGRGRWNDLSPVLAVRDSLVQRGRKLTVPITSGGS